MFSVLIRKVIGATGFLLLCFSCCSFVVGGGFFGFGFGVFFFCPPIVFTDVMARIPAMLCQEV